jgi:pristinamycin I synthase 3 and 4
MNTLDTNTLEMLLSLREKGVDLWLEDGQLNYEASKAVLTPELLASIRAKKEEIVAFLQQSKQLVTTEPERLVSQSRPERLPLSYVQERLWLVQHRDEDSIYNMSGALILDGPLSKEALEAALKGLIERHEPLRTRFVLKPGEVEPQQCIDSSAPVVLRVTKARWEEAAELVKEHAEQVFDLEQGPQLRLLVLEIAPEKHVLSMVMHHIIVDGWSINVLEHDLQELYAAAKEGRAPRLEPLEIQYADYALWQRQLDLSKGLEYWRSALSGYEGTFDLAPEKPRSRRAGRARVLERKMPPNLANALGRFSQQRQASLFMVLLSGWTLAVHRSTGQKDLCLGTTVAGRDQLALEPLIGFFINILGLRLNLTAELSGEELLEQVKEVVLQGLAHQEVPFEQVLATVPELRQEDGATPLPVMVRHQNYPQAELKPWSEVQARPFLIEQKDRAKSDLDLQYYGDASDLSVTVMFDTDRFNTERVEELLVEVEQLLGRLIEEPQRPMWRLVEPSPEELGQLDRWNDTTQSFEQTSVTELFARQVQQNPEGPACVDGEQELSYGELDRRSDNLARVLQEQGVKPGVRVVLYLPRSAEFLTALIAVWKVGGVYVGVDRSYPEAYAQRMIENASPAIVLVENGFVPSFTIGQGKVMVLEESALTQECEPLEQRAILGPDELAYIAYTSGSTGQPKGVCVEHRQLLNCLEALWKRTPFEADEVVAQKTATTFVVSLKELLSGLLTGVPQVIISDLVLRDLEAFAFELERRRVTRLNVVPSQLGALLDYAGQLKGLRHVVTAGEPLNQSMRERFEQLLPQVCLYNNYGCTELNDITYSVPGEQSSESSLVPMGRPINNLRLYVLDEQQRLVAVGVTGELYVEGAAVGGYGYWNQPALTAERFVPDPFGAPGTRLFRTGDLARRRRDGQLQYVGRKDIQIKIRGQRVEVAQVEQALREHPDIERCGVKGQGNEEQASLVAYYVAAEELSHNQLYDWLRERLPAYMVPALYVHLEKLPLLPNGKLDRRALPAADAEAYSQQKFEEPEGETERSIAAIWAELLKLPLERIGRHDNFFACGGHSLLATRVKGRLRDVLEIEVPIKILFEAPTVRELAERVEEIQREGTGVALPPLVAKPRGERIPLSYAQERLWFLEQMGLLGSAYNLPMALRIKGKLDLKALEAALKGLMERHEPLRTRFVLKPGELAPEQYIDSSAPTVLKVRQAQPEEAAGLVKEHAEQIFDLAQGPQLRVLVLEVGPQEHVLSLVMHQIIADGWAVNVLVRDLQELSAATTERRAPKLEPLEIQYADYALWQRQLDLSKGLSYWRSALSGYEGTLDLAPERPRRKQAGNASVLKRKIPPDLANELGRFSQQRQVSLFMVLLSGWALALYRQTGQKDLCLGTTVTEREQALLEPLMGFFINILGLRLDLTAEPTGEELLKQVKDVVLQGLAHQAVPFEQVLAAVPELRQEEGAMLPVIVRHQNYPEAELKPWPKGLIEPFVIEQERRAKSDLDLKYYGDASDLSVMVEFDTDRFDAERVEELLVEVEQLLGRLIEEPQKPLWRLVEPSSEELEKLERWNDTAHSFEQTSVTELFARQVKRSPGGLACVDGERELSYGELDRRSDNLARVLQEQGVKPRARVVLYLPRSVDFLTALLAVWKVGGAYVGVDRSYPEAYAQRMIEDAAPAIVLVESGFAPGFAIGQAKLVVLEEKIFKKEWKPLEQRAALGLDEVAYIAYTSGSTGQPKGVCVEHRQLLNCVQALWKQIPFEANEVVAQKTATTFVVSLRELLGGLLRGIPQVIISDLVVKDLEAFAGELERRRVTRLHLVPSQLGALLEYAEQLKGLRHVVTAGEPLSQRLRQRFEQLLPQAWLYNDYGCTELHVITYSMPGEQESENGLVPLGRPINNQRLYVLDEQQRLVAVGVTGELYVEGQAVGSHGYWNQAALTAERFVPNAFGVPGSRLFRTGDVVRRGKDGQLQYVGRKDFQVKVRGQRVELAQVEQALREHPAIERCVVMGKGDGEQGKLVAYYVGAAAAVELSHNQLYDWLKERLPAYMVPALYVALEKLPLLPNGKLDRRALPAADAKALRQQEYEEPQDETERSLAAIWAEVLELPLERIGRHNNFFTLGGHSLLAIQLISRIRTVLDVELPIHALFEAPTIAGSALRLVDQAFQTPDALSVLLPIRAQGVHPPLFCIHTGLGVSWVYFRLVQYLDDRPVYGLQARGLDGVTPLAPTLEAMVTDYIEQIRTIQPEGPYHLLGWSFGGAVAQAMAAELERQGETVALLALLDSHNSQSYRGSQITLEEQDIEKQTRNLAVSQFGAKFTTAIGESLLKILVDVTKNNLDIIIESSWPIYRGDALLFRATELSDQSIPILSAQAWEPYVLGKIEVHDLQCKHEHIDRPQPMAEIGHILADKLKALTQS